MENQTKKCSLKKHSDINAVVYCIECKRYYCNKCKNGHSELFEDHQFIDLNKNGNDIFTGLCNENNHNISLEYFCRTHNKLCCAACITKIEGEGNGQHSNCEICLLKEIKDEKINNLKQNIKILESLYNKLDSTIKNIKILFEEISKNKEELKFKIQKIFTKLRNAIDEREKKLLIEVDNVYNKYYINDNIINKSDKLPNKIKSVLEKGKIIDEGRNNNMKLNMLINDCINVENSAQEINKIFDFIEKSKSNKNIKIMFFPDDNRINEFIKEISSFGNISDNLIQINSKLVSNLDMNKIQNWLKESLGEVKIKRYELIYRATEHGDWNNVLFQRCKNQSNLLWIMKNKNNNNIFGCFNSIPISTNETYSTDTKCFLFSLIKNKIYKPNLNIGNNIYHCPSHIIEFGNNGVFEFNISEKFLSSGSVGFGPGKIFQHNNEISDNIPSITLSEMEVFRIIEWNLKKIKYFCIK